MSTLYDNVVHDRGQIDHTPAALALRKTMKSSINMPSDQRIRLYTWVRTSCASEVWLLISVFHVCAKVSRY